MLTTTIKGLRIEVTEDCDGDWSGKIIEITSGRYFDCRFAVDGDADRLFAELTAEAERIANS